MKENDWSEEANQEEYNEALHLSEFLDDMLPTQLMLASTMVEIDGSEEANQEENNEALHLSKFLDDMLPTQLSWRSPSPTNKQLDQYHWVFWDKEEEEEEEESLMHKIQHGIRAALFNFSCPELGDSLIQFWKAEMIRGRYYLTTIHQPFALSNLTSHVLLARYRKHCLGCKVAVAGDDEDNVNVNGDQQSTITEGPIGRSYLNQLPEASRDVKLYSDKEFPLRQVALNCGIKQIVALPLLVPSGQGCVGVLELLLTKDRSPPLDRYISMVGAVLERVGLETIDTYTEQYYQQILKIKGDDATEEITKALEQVCKTHHLPIACSWGRYKHKGSSIGSLDGGSCNGTLTLTAKETLVSVPCMSFWDVDTSFHHCMASYSLPFDNGKGLVGKAFVHDKPCICRDVTQLSIIEYPMAHFSQKSKLKGCFAICLQSLATGNRDYVLEFFLSRGSTFTGEVQELLSLVLEILNRELKSFEAITGDPAAGNDSFAEIDKFSFDDNSGSFETVPDFTVDLIESQALETDHGEVLRSNSYDPQWAKEDFINNGTQHVVGLIQSETPITHVEKRCVVKRSVVDNEPKENSLSRKELLRHRGKRLEDVAQIYQVSRSTFKRWCRKNDINRWPSSKRPKNSSLPHNIPDQMDGVTGCNVEPIPNTVSRDPSNSGKSLTPTDQATSNDTHSQRSRPPTNFAQTQSTSTVSDPYSCSGPPPTNSAPTQSTGTVTVKVTHMTRIIRFDLSCSSRLADLVEEVASRLNLQEGTFSFIYEDEDGDKISITTDADIRYCMKLFNYSTIRLLVDDQPITNKSS